MPMKAKNLLKTLTLTMALLIAGKVGWAQAKIIISEVTDASSYAAEYVELYNAGDAAQDLIDWKLQQYGATQSTTFSSTITTNMTGNYTLNPGEYVVVCRGTLVDLQTAYPSFSGYYFTTNSTSSGAPSINGSEYFELYDATSTIVDHMGSSTSTMASGKTYDRNDALSDGLDLSVDWTVLANTEGTPGAANATTLANDMSAGDTPPQATFDPANGATGVLIGKTITITFDEKIYQSNGTTEIVNADLPALITVQEGGVEVSDGDFTMTYDNTTYTITIDPTSDLSYDKDYTVSFGAVYDDAAQENAGGSATFHTELGYIPITKAYAISSDAVDVVYQSDMSSINAGDYNLTGTAAITFSTATVDGTDATIVHLSGASAPMVGDVTLDNIADANTNADFYAGITPIALTSMTNAGGKIDNDQTATFVGIVSANDAYNNVWVADAEGAYNGILIYDSNFDGLVNVGDEVKFTGTLTQYSNLTELKNPVLIETISSGNTPYGPSVITGATISDATAADTDPAESWEGQLVKIDNATITSDKNTSNGTGHYYYPATDDSGTTTFRIGDNVNYNLTAITLVNGRIYNITGVVDYDKGAYRVNPRDINDIYLLSNDASLSAFTLGGEDAIALTNVSVADPVNDAGATMYVSDFTSFAGIAATTTNTNATFTVTLDGTTVDPGDYATQALADGNIVVVTVTAEDGTMGYYKVTLTGENRTLTVTAPVGGETYNTGDDAVITWTSANITNVNIYAENAVTSDLYEIALNIDATLGTYTYTIQNGNFGEVYIHVTDATDANFYDNSDGTVTVTDNVAPSISDRYPAIDATNIATSFTLSLTFDEDVEAGAGNVTVYKTDDNTAVATIAVAECTINDETVTCSVSGLSNETSYYVTVDAGTFKDHSNNDIVAVAANDWSFTTVATPIGDLFISEYIEPAGGNNKALEIYNPTGTAIDLSHYSIKMSYNGGGWGIYSGAADTRYVLPLTGTLDSKDVYVIINADADATQLIDAADLSLTYNSTPNGCDGCLITSFNGNDAIGLFKDDVLIDQFGDPTSSVDIDVAGVTGGGKDHTVLRKSNVTIGNTNWTESAGTNADNSEWIVKDANYFDDLGTFGISSDAEVLTFTLAEQTGNATINSEAGTVSIEVLNGTNASNLTPTITVSAGATISPESNVAQDFTNPVVYTVTAEDGTTTKDWTVTVTVASTQSSEKDITSFSIPNQLSDATIDATAGTVTVLMPNGTNLTSLAPTIAVSAGATINPTSGTARDFTNPVTYTVTAQDASTKDWTVTVTAQQITVVTIHDIQYTTDASGDSPYLGQTVKTSGIVTAISGSNLWIQDGTGAWNGVMIYSSATAGAVSVGDEINFTCDVSEYYGLTELQNIADLTTVSTGNTLPEATTIAVNESITEEYESVLIKFAEITVTAVGGDNKIIYTASNGTATVYVDRNIYEQTGMVVGNKFSVTGIGNYSYDNFRISPRSAADVVVVNAVPTNTISNLKVYPNPFNDAIHFNGANVSRVTITSIIGQVVMDVNANGLQTINTQHLQKGIYVVRFTNNNGESVLRKLIKQ